MTLDFNLHPKQGLAYQTEATEVLFGGAAGPGKSHFLRIASIIWAAAIPGLQVYLFRRLSSDLVQNHWEGVTGYPALLSPWVESGYVQLIHSQPNEVKFRNSPTGSFDGGSRIFLCHCQHEKDKYKYQGSEIHVLLMDELTHFTETIYRFLRGRVRLGGLKIPEQFLGLFPRIFNASNPGNIGHLWVKATFIDPKPAMEIWKTPPSEGGFLRQFIPARLDDNPTLRENDPNYADRLSGLGNETLVRAMLDGDWDIVAGALFSDVWDAGVHVLKPFNIPSSWRVDRSFDWGSSKPFSVGWWAEADGTEASNGFCPPRGTLIRIAEYYGWSGKPNEGVNMTASEISKEIREREAAMLASGLIQRKPEPGPADSSIYDVVNGMCIAGDMEKHGVTWIRANKKPGSRVNGWERMRNLLKAAMVQPLDSPALFVFDTCRHFIRTIPVLPRDERKPDDCDTAAEDHVGDESRYRCLCGAETSKNVDWS